MKKKLKNSLKLFTKEQVKELLEAMSSEKLVSAIDKWKKNFEDEPERFGRFKIIITTEDQDRAGDSVSLDGWDTKDYLKNPIVLWAHDYHGLPIGVTTSLEKTKKGLVAEGFFAPEEANPHAQQVRKLYDLGMIRTASVGFIPKEFDKCCDLDLYLGPRLVTKRIHVIQGGAGFGHAETCTAI